MNTTCSTSEAAEILGVSHKTVQLWVESGRLRAWKTAGGHRRILVSSLVASLGNQSVKIVPALIGFTRSRQRKRDVSRRIIVCDSSEDMRATFRKYASHWTGVKWAFSKCNFDALLKIGAIDPRVFITEICSSGIDIAYMVRILLAHPKTYNMKIILTSDLSEETLRALDLHPTVKILKKPFTQREVFDAINNALGDPGLKDKEL